MIFKLSQTTPPLTTPNAGQPVPPPTSSSPASPTNTTPARKNILPDQQPKGTNSTATDGAATKATTNEAATKATTDEAILQMLDPTLWTDLKKLENDQKTAETNYASYTAMLENLMGASLASSMKMPVQMEFCSVMGIADETAVVDSEEISGIYEVWSQYAENYLKTFKGVIAAWEKLGAALTPFLDQNPEYKKMNTPGYITLKIAEVFSEYNKANTLIVIKQRQRAKFFAMLPLQEEFFTLMATLCPIQQDKDATKDTLGFAFNEQYQALMKGFDQAIVLANALARVVLNSWKDAGNKSARQNAMKYLAIAAGFKKEKKVLVNESAKRYRVQ